MKRSRSSSPFEERPGKLPRHDKEISNHSVSGSILKAKRTRPEQLPSPFSSQLDNFQDGVEGDERDNVANSSLNPLPPASDHAQDAKQRETDSVYDWLQTLPADPELMSQPLSKRSRSRSPSVSRGRRRSVSTEGTESTSSRDARSSAYKATNYVTILETKRCFMRRSALGPVSEDIEFCKRLLHQEVPIPEGTMFDDEFFEGFHNILQNRSEARLLVDLHPLLMPSAENCYIRGRRSLENVIDAYNDLWLKTDPIYGPRPQPDHARGLKWSTFSEDQRRKLEIKPDEKSPYTAREDMYFPYLTCEIKNGNQALQLADRQNMHSMCVALRALVHLSRIAGCPETLHRRLLGFSISHDLETVQIYGYYPEVEGDKTSYFRWPITRFSIWTDEGKWTCYRFVENLDEQFLPIHLRRVMDMLAQIADPPEASFTTDLEDLDNASQSSSAAVASALGSQEGVVRRTAPSRGRGLQPELRTMIQTLQQQLEQQKIQLEQQRRREEELLEQQRMREERFLEQMEQQKKDSERQQQQLMQLLTEALGAQRSNSRD